MYNQWPNKEIPRLMARYMDRANKLICASYVQDLMDDFQNACVNKGISTKSYAYRKMHDDLLAYARKHAEWNHVNGGYEHCHDN